MPKVKTHSGAKKRFRKTGSGRILARHGMTSHNLGKKAAKRKRRLGRPRGDQARRRDRGEAAARRWKGRAVTRVKRSVHARKKRRAVLERAKGYRGEKHSSYRRAKEQVLKSDSYAYRDRRARKRDFRALWIVRINAAARREGLTYSRMMAGLRVAEVEVNRKMLADVAVRDPETFRRFAERAKQALEVSAAGS